MKTKKVQEIKPVSKGLIKNLSEHKYAYLMILPSMIAVFVFLYLPLLGLIFAFKEYDMYKGIMDSPWVGLDNFVLIFNQPAMLNAIGNTLKLSLINLVGGYPFPILLAILFNEVWNLKFKKVVQTVTYLPHFLSMVSVVGLVYTLFAIEGPVNEVMSQIVGEGYEKKNILMDSKYFLPVAFWTGVWKNTGWNSVLFLAAITGIDPALYEAATIDGAGKLRQIWHITLPGIRTTLIITFVMKMGSLFQSNFELVYGLQNVKTIDDTEVINTLIYRTGIQQGNYSAATAFGLSHGLITVTLIMTANAVSKKIAEVSIW